MSSLANKDIHRRVRGRSRTHQCQRGPKLEVHIPFFSTDTVCDCISCIVSMPTVITDVWGEKKNKMQIKQVVLHKRQRKCGKVSN